MQRKIFLNLFKLNQTFIVTIIFLLIWYQQKSRSVPNKMEHCDYFSVRQLHRQNYIYHVLIICTYTQINIFEVLSNQAEIRLYLLFSD